MRRDKYSGRRTIADSSRASKQSVRDVDAKVEERLADFGDNEDLRDSMRQYFTTGYGFDMMSSEILMDKVSERAEAIYAGEAPDLVNFLGLQLS